MRCGSAGGRLGAALSACGREREAAVQPPGEEHAVRHACVHHRAAAGRVAQCDWSEDNPVCAGFKTSIAACPIWDALALDAIERQARNLTYLEPGGTARGFGRCAEACKPGPSPPLPEWCSGGPAAPPPGLPGPPRCNESWAEWGQAEWCDALDDGGRVVGTDLLDYGAAWGVCSGRRLLPFAGLDYDRAALLATLN
eukprot:1171381-Rhodomonas_salina.1